jgi:hypothetical protein
MGLSTYSKDKYGGGKREQFLQGTEQFSRYIETWVDKNHSIRISLMLDYEGINDNHWPKEINVACQVTKFFDFIRWNAFNEKLKKSGKEKQFKLMLGKYTKKDGEIDLERALKENPNNKELKEFHNIIREINN